MTESGMKSAYEIALERLEQQGIKKPDSESLTDQDRAQVAEIRSKAKAELANLEILHRARMAEAGAPEAHLEDEKNYQQERIRIEERRDREIARLRSG